MIRSKNNHRKQFLTTDNFTN